VTHPPWVGSRSPDGWDQIPYRPGGWILHQPPLEFWVQFPNERNQGKQAHPVLKYRVPHGSECVMGRLVHTGLGSSSLVAHVLPYPPPPHVNSFVLGPAVINTRKCETTCHRYEMTPPAAGNDTPGVFGPTPWDCETFTFWPCTAEKQMFHATLGS
jgi:hypothetical protein